MKVLDGWSISEEKDNFYELVVKKHDVAVHITLLGRDGNRLRTHEARDLILVFLRKVGTSHGEIIGLDVGPSQQRALSEFDHTDDEGRVREWLVCSIVWPEVALICSYLGSPGEPFMDEARQMFNSIRPLS